MEEWMLFNSWDFLLFFTVVTTLYYLFSHRYRWFILLTASCFFYMVYIPSYILVLAFLILIDYSMGLMIEKATAHHKKYYLITSIVSMCSVLFSFKYFNFFNENLVQLATLLHWNYSFTALQLLLPIGLSFHTFQGLSYVIEVYKGHQKAERNLGIYALYIMFYPQLVSGPIERPQNMLPQFHEQKSFDYHRVVSGLILMAWGLFKKVVIADSLAVLVATVYDQPSHFQSAVLITATLFFAVQIYCDFSGYTDIARGAARVMGFNLTLNFDHPYAATSLTDFWRRWHISLSSWLRDYIYTPIVLRKRYWGIWGMVYALMITFIISGIWHGASWTFVIWGLLHGLGLSYEILTAKFRNKYFKYIPRWIYSSLGTLVTFSFVCFTYIFFRAKNISDGFYIATHLFETTSWINPMIAWPQQDAITAKWLIFTLFAIEYLQRRKILWTFIQIRWWLRWPAYYSLMASMMALGQWFSPQQFIYFQF
jgi:alginate O-acetyltransferase complex protein AlgI